MTQDGVELADVLRKQLRKDKIILVGHSWGSILGVHMAKARPDLFYALSARARWPTRRRAIPWHIENC